MKSYFKCEKYLVAPMATKYKVCMARLCLSCHKLEIETGRYHKPYPNPRMTEYAHNVLLAELKTRHIFIFSCKKYDALRTRLYSNLQDINVTLNVHDQNALKILDCDDIRVLLCLGRFISQCLLLRS